MAQDHPVWDVYDLLRTVRLNELYYGMRLQSCERKNLALEVLIACTSSTSALGALAFWQSTAGKPFWQTLVAIVAILAVAKPFFNLSKKVKSYEELLMAYKLIAHDLRALRLDISQARSYDKAHRIRLKEINDRLGKFVNRSPERVDDSSTKKICTERVLEELPKKEFFIPGAHDEQ